MRYDDDYRSSKSAERACAGLNDAIHCGTGTAGKQYRNIKTTGGNPMNNTLKDLVGHTIISVHRVEGGSDIVKTNKGEFDIFSTLNKGVVVIDNKGAE